MFPSPQSLKYKIEIFLPYKLHQQCSNKFHVGNIVLAEDATYANNPFRGMGFTTELCNAGGLVNCFISIFKKGCSDNLLNKYAEIHIEKFHKVSPTWLIRN
jgi:2-polyprenyl-6-methoxyphenol hydroxylase-like FAD-dependent oxidoreductase